MLQRVFVWLHRWTTALMADFLIVIRLDQTAREKICFDLAGSGLMKRLIAVAGDYLPSPISCRKLGRWNLKRFRRLFCGDRCTVSARSRETGLIGGRPQNHAR